MSFTKLTDFIKAKTSKAVFGFGLLLSLTACLGGDSSPQVNLNEPVRVALMVPSGGSNAAINEIGLSIKNAAKLALADYNQNNDIELMIFETGGDENNAASMAVKAREQGASIILGPLMSLEAIHVEKAVPGIPVWTFSNNTATEGENTYVFGTTFDVVADRIVSYAKANGANTLGIVATDDIGGEVGLKASQLAAIEHGVAVVYATQYPLTVAAIEKNAPGIAAALKTSGAEAVMFTDTPNAGLGIMANALAAQGYSSSSSQYLGISRWDDNSEFLKQAKLEGGLFAAPDLAKANAFNAHFKSAYGTNAHSLAGLGYDGVTSIIQLVKTAKSKRDKTPFGNNDIKRAHFDGVMGAFRFGKDNQADRALAVMQVQNGNAIVVSAAPESM